MTEEDEAFNEIERRSKVKQEQGEPDYKTLAIQLQQQRTWVGLTNAEKQEIWAMNETAMVISATEAKLKEKNS
jgi:hypothetical protein